MRNIEELPPLMLELLELPFDDTDEIVGFSDRAVEIINEIADFAEGTKLYKSNKDRSEALDGLSAKQTYAYLLDRIANAPGVLYRDGSCILIMPILRQKIKEERK